MPFITYAYRIGREAALLDEGEWSVIAPLLQDRLTWIKKYRTETGCSIEEARKREPIGMSALDKYEELTGVRLEHPDQLWAIQMKFYGSLCPRCSKPFRTPKAKMCADCGYELPKGLLAGPLGDIDH